MRSTKLVLAAFALVFVFGGALSAQLAGDRPDPVEAKSSSFVKSVSLSAYFNNYLYMYNNGDLRETDNTSYQTVEVTDDNFFIGYLEMGGTLKAELLSDITFYMDAYRVGFYGNDMPEYVSANPIYFRHIYFNLPVIDNLLSAQVGRFRYSSIDSSCDPDRLHHNYVLTDINDAVLLTLNTGIFGIDLMGDLFSMNAPIDAVYELHAHKSDTVKYFNGDVNILRFAFIPFIKPLNEENSKVSLRPYAMFSRIGATGKSDGTEGGHEWTSAGATGNMADNDWILMAGLSTYTRFGGFSAAVEFGYSMGKDRKGPGIDTVDFSGIMIHGSLAYEIGDLFSVTAAGIYSSGAETDYEGNYKNYGYVSFKADKVGGFLFRDYYGVYPYGILGSTGIAVRPSEASKRSPVAAGMFRASLDGLNPLTFQKDRNGLDIDVEFWAYLDTSKSGIDFANDSANILATLAPEMFDQKRFGNFMGWELDVTIAWSVNNDLLTIGVDLGMFVPGKFYAYPVSNIRSPFGNDTFYGLTVFSALRF
jgi:hypothetical protein